MRYCKAFDELPLLVNIILAIFAPIVHFIYAVILDGTQNKPISLILDIVSFVCFGIVFYVLNLVFIIGKKEIFAFSKLNIN